MAKTIDKTKQPYWKIFLRFTLVPIALFFLFKKLFFELFTSTFVKYIFSKVGEPSTETDIAAIFICFVVIIFFAPKIFKGAVIPDKWLYLTLTYCIIYFSFRIDPSVENSKLQFIAFKNHPNIYLSDLTIVIPLILGFFVFIHYDIKPQLPLFKVELPEIDTAKGFTVEEPTIIKTDDDLLGRSKFIENLANQIRNTKPEKGSFPIGISASWGSGKTTFLKSLLKQFEGDKNFVIIELDVWKAGKQNLIIETLFKELREKLKDYSFTLNNKLPEYASDLTKVSKEGFETFKTLSELAFPTESLEKQFDTISKAIKATNKKIIISIDDLDRLDKKEVYEVIKLIRNTANFANTFFIVAYDRNYILNAIEVINPHEPYIFLEKIFQLEFSLPPFNEKILQNEVFESIYNFLSADDKIFLENMIYSRYSPDRIGINLINSFILNFRDVIRFSNSLKLQYEFVKGEIYFPDFYNLQLIRFKHPEIYTQFYKNYSKYLDFKGGTDDIMFNGFRSKTYFLNTLKTKIFLEDKKFKLNEKEIEVLTYAFETFFHNRSQFSDAHLENSYFRLSAVRPSMIGRYFLDAQGIISEIEFSKIRAKPSVDFNSEITKLCKDSNSIIEIDEKLMSIKNFDNREDFEKIINAIVHFVNLPKPKGKFMFEYVRYDLESFYVLLDDSKNLEFYDKDLSQYKEFIVSFFGIKAETKKFDFQMDFLKTISDTTIHSKIQIFNEQFVYKILFEIYKNALNELKDFIDPLWQTYDLCFNQDVKFKNVPDSLNVKEMLIKFILEKDMDGFILTSAISYITDTPRSGLKSFYPSSRIEKLFGSYENFIERLKNYSKNSEYKDEFIAFYEEYNKDLVRPQKVHQNFFKKIPIDKIAYND